MRSSTLTPQTMPEINVDFRAPPPSPVASGRKSPFANDDVLTDFLETSLHVPDLVLPDKIFPKQNQQEKPPEVDFVSLCFHKDDDLRDVVLDSMARIGCFQLLNHGISTQLMADATDAAKGIFLLPPGKRAAATRSPEKPWGFEEYHEGEEDEKQGSEFSEEFVWCNDEELKLKMEGIWPIGYSNFSNKLKILESRVEMLARKILAIILEKVPRKMTRGNEVGTVCCILKHQRDIDGTGSDELVDSLKYDVIRMLIRGTDYSHSLCFHLCNGSSEFHIYSKKTWLSFTPKQAALIVTTGDQIQISSSATTGHYKHVIGRPIFKGEKKDIISMSFLCSPHDQNTKNDVGTTISLAQQLIVAIVLTLMYHILVYV